MRNKEDNVAGEYDEAVIVSRWADGYNFMLWGFVLAVWR